MNTTLKLLRIEDVSQKTTLAKSTLWLKISQGVFPKPTKLSPAINVWKESDIDNWIESHFVRANESTQNQLFGGQS
jgi:prophage regulatory protein